MNKARREAINQIISSMELLKDKVEALRDEEQDYFDVMPESLQLSEKGETAEAAIENLDLAVDAFEDLFDHLNNAADGPS